MRTSIRRTPDGRYVPRIVSSDTLPGRTLAKCEDHRHWTRITALDCGSQLIARLERENPEPDPVAPTCPNGHDDFLWLVSGVCKACLLTPPLEEPMRALTGEDVD